MTDKTCEFCGSALSGYAEAEFKGNVTISATCPKCGTYTLTPDLVAELPKLEANKRAKMTEFLSGSWAMLGVPQEIDLNFVNVMLPK